MLRDAAVHELRTPDRTLLVEQQPPIADPPQHTSLQLERFYSKVMRTTAAQRVAQNVDELPEILRAVGASCGLGAGDIETFVTQTVARVQETDARVAAGPEAEAAGAAKVITGGRIAGLVRRLLRLG
jgi:hypothetical protein